MRPQPQPPFHHMNNNNNNMRGPMPPGPGFKDGSNQPLINPAPFSMEQQQQQPTAPYPMQPKMPQPMNFGILLSLSC